MPGVCYFVRIELHGSNPNYTRLHEEMLKRNFARQIEGYDDNKNVGFWKLPTATYVTYWEPNRMKELRAKAAEAARTTGHPYWVLVIQSVDSAWESERV